MVHSFYLIGSQITGLLRFEDAYRKYNDRENDPFSHGFARAWRISISQLYKLEKYRGASPAGAQTAAHNAGYFDSGHAVEKRIPFWMGGAAVCWRSFNLAAWFYWMIID
jgi:hypothetical protein